MRTNAAHARHSLPGRQPDVPGYAAAEHRRLPDLPSPYTQRMGTNAGARARAVYQDATLTFPATPQLSTGGCPYRGLTLIANPTLVHTQ